MPNLALKTLKEPRARYHAGVKFRDGSAFNEAKASCVNACYTVRVIDGFLRSSLDKLYTPSQTTRLSERLRATVPTTRNPIG